MPRVIRTNVVLHVVREVEVAPGIKVPPGAYFGWYLKTTFSDENEPRTGWSDPRYMIQLSAEQLAGAGKKPVINFNTMDFDVSQHIRSGAILP